MERKEEEDRRARRKKRDHLKGHERDSSNNHCKSRKEQTQDPKNERPLLPSILMAETIKGNNHAGVRSAKRQGQADITSIR